MTPCSLLSYNRSLLAGFAEIISFCRNYFFYPEDGGDMFLRNVCLTQQTARRHIPEDDTLHNHCCENLKSYVIFLVSRSCDSSTNVNGTYFTNPGYPSVSKDNGPSPCSITVPKSNPNICQVRKEYVPYKQNNCVCSIIRGFSISVL
jgi:hypothetical protein